MIETTLTLKRLPYQHADERGCDSNIAGPNDLVLRMSGSVVVEWNNKSFCCDLVHTIFAFPR